MVIARLAAEKRRRLSALKSKKKRKTVKKKKTFRIYDEKGRFVRTGVIGEGISETKLRVRAATVKKTIKKTQISEKEAKAREKQDLISIAIQEQQKQAKLQKQKQTNLQEQQIREQFKKAGLTFLAKTLNQNQLNTVARRIQFEQSQTTFKRLQAVDKLPVSNLVKEAKKREILGLNQQSFQKEIVEFGKRKTEAKQKQIKLDEALTIANKKSLIEANKKLKTGFWKILGSPVKYGVDASAEANIKGKSVLSIFASDVTRMLNRKTLKAGVIGVGKGFGDLINDIVGIKGITIDSKGKTFDGLIAAPSRKLITYGQNLVKRAEAGKTPKHIIKQDITRFAMATGKVSGASINVVQFAFKEPELTALIVGAAISTGIIASKKEFLSNPAENTGRAIAWLFPGKIIKGVISSAQVTGKGIKTTNLALNKFRRAKLKNTIDFFNVKDKKKLLMTTLTSNASLGSEAEFLYTLKLNKLSESKLLDLIKSKNNQKSLIQKVKKEAIALRVKFPKKIKVKSTPERGLNINLLILESGLTETGKVLYLKTLNKLNSKQIKNIIKSKLKQKSLIQKIKENITGKKVTLLIKTETKLSKLKGKITSKKKKDLFVSSLVNDSKLNEVKRGLYKRELEKLNLKHLTSILKNRKTRINLIDKIKKSLTGKEISLFIKVQTKLLKLKGKITMTRKRNLFIGSLVNASGLNKIPKSLYRQQLEKLNLKQLTSILKNRKTRINLIDKIKSKAKDIKTIKKLGKVKVKIISKVEQKKAFIDFKKDLKKQSHEVITFIDLKQNKVKSIPKNKFIKSSKNNQQLVQVFKEKAIKIESTTKKAIKLKPKLKTLSSTQKTINFYSKIVSIIGRSLIIARAIKNSPIIKLSPDQIKIINNRVSSLKKSLIDVKVKLKDMNKQAIEQGIDLKLVKAQDIVQVLGQSFKYDTVLIQILKLKFKPSEPIIPKKIKFRLSFKSKVPKGFSRKVNGFVKVGNKRIKVITGLPENKAWNKVFKKGTRKFRSVDGSLARSFEFKIIGLTKAKDDKIKIGIKKTTSRIGKDPKVLQVVEKVKHSIDTKGEKKGLKLAKRSKPKSKKKKKKTVKRATKHKKSSKKKRNIAKNGNKRKK